MVVAQQVQHGVHGQKGHFALQRMAVEICLLQGTLHADDDIAQHHAAVVLVHIVFAVLAQRKAEHVGGHRLVAVLVVQLGNGRIVHEGDADLGGCIKMLVFQHCVAGAADQDAQARRDLHGLLGVGDQNFIGHKSVHSFPFFRSEFCLFFIFPGVQLFHTL